MATLKWTRIVLSVLYGLASSSAVAVATQNNPTLYEAFKSGSGVDFLINVAVATTGGLTHSAFLLKSTKTSIRSWLNQAWIDMLVSAFAGVIVFSLTSPVDIDPFIQLSLVGIAGWGGGSVLDNLTRKYYGNNNNSGNNKDDNIPKL